MAWYNYNGTNSKQIAKGYNYNGTNSKLIYNAQSDTYTLTATTTPDYYGTNGKSETITNTEGYEKLVIESVVVSGGNYGVNRAQIAVNGAVWLTTGNTTTPDAYRTKAQSLSGERTVERNATVYVEVHAEVDWNIDDAGDPVTFTLKFHFE